jgi:hypothetical protein
MILGQDVVAQSRLDVEESPQGEAREASVLGVPDLAVGGVAEGGAEDADRGFAVALDFEVDRVATFDCAQCALCEWKSRE